MNEELLIQKAEQAIEALAYKLGVASEHFWPLFVKQQLIEGWTSMVLLVATTVVASTLLTMGCLQKGTFFDDDDDHPRPRFFLTIAGSLGLFFSVTMILIDNGLARTFSHIVNPEYQALRDLIGMVK